MDDSTRSLIEAIHLGPTKYVLALTGGGATAPAWLLSVPGGSRNLLEVAVPYHELALADYLGHIPAQYCSAETARCLAERARERAAWLAPHETVCGVACTAGLVSDRPKRGDHRFFLAVATGLATRVFTMTLAKGARHRAGEEEVVAVALVNALAEVQGIAERIPLPMLADEKLREEIVTNGGLLAALVRGERAVVTVELDGRLRADAPLPKLLLPGSFNPLHEGHRHLAVVASSLTTREAAFEISVANADKPALTLEEIEHRRRHFAWRAPLVLTNAPTFADKAALFPGATFVVGADTAARIVLPRFYGDDEARMAAALGHIRAQGCRFLVAGRVEAGGRFVGRDDLALPVAFADLFAGIHESAFRRDVSATQLRAQGITV